MSLSARNHLAGIVEDITLGDVLAHVTVTRIAVTRRVWHCGDGTSGLRWPGGQAGRAIYGSVCGVTRNFSPVARLT